MANVRTEYKKWIKKQPVCIGYPGCDGDLEGVEHSEKCPLSKFKNSAGKVHLVTREEAFKAGWEARGEQC